MSFLLKQMIKQGGKRAKSISEIDAASPITADTVDFAVEIGKGILKIGKELMF
jgi:hypothetical protein